MDNCREVDVDVNGKMIPEHLEKLILEDKANGCHPFFVNCTSGSTVIGAFDPINAIADVCQKHGVWLHIDVRSIKCNFYFIHTVFHKPLRTPVSIFRV